MTATLYFRSCHPFFLVHSLASHPPFPSATGTAQVTPKSFSKLLQYLPTTDSKDTSSFRPPESSRLLTAYTSLSWVIPHSPQSSQFLCRPLSYKQDSLSSRTALQGQTGSFVCFLLRGAGFGRKKKHVGLVFSRYKKRADNPSCAILRRGFIY